jgi:hypothetical protein
MVAWSPESLTAQSWNHWAPEPKAAVRGIRELLCAGGNGKESNERAGNRPRRHFGWIVWTERGLCWQIRTIRFKRVLIEQDSPRANELDNNELTIEHIDIRVRSQIQRRSNGPSPSSWMSLLIHFFLISMQQLLEEDKYWEVMNEMKQRHLNQLSDYCHSQLTSWTNLDHPTEAATYRILIRVQR